MIRVFNIVWDTEDNGEVIDPKECNLPSETEIPNGIDHDDIADYLSDEYGWCVVSYKTE